MAYSVNTLGKRTIHTYLHFLPSYHIQIHKIKVCMYNVNTLGTVNDVTEGNPQGVSFIKGTYVT